MLAKLQTLKNQIEHDSETTLSAAEIEFLNSITTLDDLKRSCQNGAIQALAYDAALALGATKIEAEMITGEADPASMTKIKLYYHDGEYLTGYELHGELAKMLEKIGLAKWVDGWGYLVSDLTVKVLGTEFYYYQALEYAKPAMIAKKKEKDSAEAARKNIFAEAVRTNKPVVLDQYTDDCNDPSEECNLDNVVVYALPNGKTKTVRSHTW